MAAVQSLMLRVVWPLLILTVAATTATLVAIAPASAQFVPRFDGRTFGADVMGEYFYSDENLDGSDGSREAIVGDSFETFTVRGNVDFSLSQNWIVGAGGEIVNASSSNSNTAFNNLDNDRSATEFNNASIFTSYQWQTGSLRIVPTLRGTFTLQEVSKTTNDIVTGEGSNQGELGAWGIIETGSLEPYIYGGYRYQDDGRAHLMPWKVGSQLNLSGFFFRGELGGHFTVKDDRYTSRKIERTTVTNRVNAGSYRYYSVNPNMIEVRLEAGIPISNELEIIGGGTHTLAGEAVAYGYSMYAAVRYSQNPKDLRRTSDDDLAARIAEDNAEASRADREAREEKAKTQKRSVRRAKKNEFTPQLEDYDPSMFEKEMGKKKKKPTN